MIFEPIETRLPHPLLLANPVGQFTHAHGIQPTRSSLAVDALLDQSATPEDAHMARDRLVGQVEWSGEFADGRLAPREPTDDRPAGRVPEGREGRIHIGIAVISQCRHARQHIRNGFVVQPIRLTQRTRQAIRASLRWEPATQRVNVTLDGEHGIDGAVERAQLGRRQTMAGQIIGLDEL